ncbi:hypothetical protein STEG23_007541, partial [Scotinomys teguina]
EMDCKISRVHKERKIQNIRNKILPSVDKCGYNGIEIPPPFFWTCILLFYSLHKGYALGVHIKG